jgi:AcrR family transcriptional regulator
VTRPAPSRAAILDAAAAAILRDGVRGLRVERVARDAGVSTALLYYHFNDRAGLVRAALDLSNAEAPSTAVLKAAHAETGRARVTEALLAEFGDAPAVRRNTVIWNEVTALAAFDPELRADVLRVTQGWAQMVAAAIRAGIADGSISGPVDPDLAAHALTSLCDGLSVRWLAGALELSDARRQLRLALDAVLGPG